MGPTMAKCPECGGNLGYDVEHECLSCPNCLKSFFIDQVKRENKKESGTKVKGYRCNNCGAQIVTSESTISTECYYCHSPVVLTDRIENNGSLLRRNLLIKSFSIEQVSATSQVYTIHIGILISMVKVVSAETETLYMSRKRATIESSRQTITIWNEKVLSN